MEKLGLNEIRKMFLEFYILLLKITNFFYSSVKDPAPMSQQQNIAASSPK